MVIFHVFSTDWRVFWRVKRLPITNSRKYRNPFIHKEKLKSRLASFWLVKRLKTFIVLKLKYDFIHFRFHKLIGEVRIYTPD